MDILELRAKARDNKDLLLRLTLSAINCHP
jgi:hypothetical protein